MSDQNLTALLEGLTDGDDAAAERAYQAYEAYLRAVVRRRLPDRLRTRFDSTDVVQSVWADLVHGLRQARWQFASEPQLRAFLVKMTRNRLIDRVRKHQGALDRELPLSGDDVPELPANQQPRPSEVAQADELWESMLDLCPPGHQEVLRLKRRGLSAAEIAAQTGLHEDSIHRILRTLARRLTVSRTLDRPASPDGA